MIKTGPAGCYKRAAFLANGHDFIIEILTAEKNFAAFNALNIIALICVEVTDYTFLTVIVINLAIRETFSITINYYKLIHITNSYSVCNWVCICLKWLIM